MNKRKEVLVLGFALFAMFFGAGNLIFPPSVGINMGDNWLLAGLGFLLTGVGLPLLGVLAFTKVGELENFSTKVSKFFNNAYCSVLVLVIGPLFAIPRTGSTTIEMGVLPALSNMDKFTVTVVSSVIFFAVTLLLVIKESKITDIIGKFLTPIILVILLAITVLGVTGDLGTPVHKVESGMFAFGFIQGYQTMDALASVLFGVVIVKGLKGKGIEDSREQSGYLTGAGVIAAIGLGLIYFSLMYLGARISGVENSAATTASALYIAEATLGSIGKMAFGICVAAACLTTSVGLVALTSDWFSRITPFSYKTIAVATCVFSSVMAIGGVDFIIQLSVPVLCILYPITIVLILFNVFGLENELAYKAGVYITLLISIVETLGVTFKIGAFTNAVQLIPLGKDGFAWLVPCVIVTAVAFAFSRKATK